jgi:7-cyano-7-deazaguanine synthase
MKKSICVLASGGADSSILLADFLKRGFDVYPLYVKSGFYWEKVELIWLKRLLRALKSSALKSLAVAEAPMRGILRDHWSLSGHNTPSANDPDLSVYLPGRNIVLLSQAGIFCALRKIPSAALAILKGNPFPDATPEFLRAMEKSLAVGLNFPIRLRAPYAGLKKRDLTNRVANFPLHLTFSCLSPRGRKHCGRCNKCAERQAILDRLND